MRRLLPGLFLCGLVVIAAAVLQTVEEWIFGRAWLEALVLAILVGVGVRTLWKPDERWGPGIAFSAKTLLEIAVLLLGASISAPTVMAVGSSLLVGIAVVVIVVILVSYGFSRALGLRHRMALLVACGNSICGNSAIVAVAPVIGASGEDIAASIAFTAVLGVGVVLALPLLVPLIHLSELQYGVVAGLTVYAVPQVLAATTPIGTVSVQIGTTVKLVRVLMLGPVIFVLSLLGGHRNGERDRSVSTNGELPGPAPAEPRCVGSCPGSSRASSALQRCDHSISCHKQAWLSSPFWPTC
jgi:uncharacterized integral membrane protein (TIGR00698 family)